MMDRVRSPFTPGYLPYRPRGTGWVAYHDVATLPGHEGIAMSWRHEDGALRWAAVMDRLHEGRVTAAGFLGEDQHLSQAIGDMLAGRRTTRSVTEAHVLWLMFPSADMNQPTAMSAGLPPLGERATLARLAVEAATIPEPMRDALTACLDHGVPGDFSLAPLRARTLGRNWPALAVMARHPTLARNLLAMDKSLLMGDDPMAAIRARWPAMTPAHLRRLETDGKARVAMRSSSRATTYAAVSTLLSVPLDWWPEASAKPGFETCSDTLWALSTCQGLDSRVLMSSCKGDWNAYAARLCRAAGIEDGPRRNAALDVRARDCDDPVRSLVRQLLVPLLASSSDEGTVASLELACAPNPTGVKMVPGKWLSAARVASSALLYGGKSAAAVLEVSRDWHARQAAMGAEIRGGDGSTEWPPLFEGEFRHGDVGIVAIGDYASLCEEGDIGPDRDGVTGLNHCVATRLPDCLSGSAHVLSVRLHADDGTWSRLSTCEVGVEAGGDGMPGINVSEHRGWDNGLAPSAAIDALQAFGEAVRAGDVHLEPRALARAGDGAGGGIERTCGYDWREPEALGRALAVWEPLLPRWCRGLGPEGLLGALVERGVIPEPPAPESPGMRP